MPVLTQQFLYGHLHRVGLVVSIERRFQRGTYSRMIDALREGHGESVGTDDPAR